MRNVLSLKVALVLAVCVVAPSAAYAAGESEGRIEGTVTEAASGAPVPGATVTVSGPSLIGGPKTLTTDDGGRYEAVGLPGGRYDVEVSYSGVKPIKRRVVVRLGETTPLDIQWSPELAQAEVTVVVEERHMTKPDSTQTGTVISSESEGKIALASRRYQFFADQVAGVTGSDGGLFQNVKGGNFVGNRYLIDGLDITDPVTNTFSANLNIDIVASEEILTGGMEAQYNALGGIFNVITSSGSDEWHVDASLYVNNSNFSAANKYGSQLYDGYRQFLNRDSPPTQQYQANLNIGGPLLKHRLWFNISGEYLYEEFSSPAGPPINVQHPSFFRHQFLGHLKLTWAPNDKHRITLVAHTDPAFLNNFDGRFAGSANYQLGVAEDRQNQGGVFVALTWEYFKSQNLNAQVNAGYQWQLLDHGPQGVLGTVDIGPTDQYGMYGYSDKNKMYDPNANQHNNLVDNTIWYQGGPVSYDRRQTVSLDPSLSVRGQGAGYHDAKFGIQSRFVYHTLEEFLPGSKTDGGPFAYNDNNGGPLEMGLCNENFMGSGHAGGPGCFQRSHFDDFHQSQWGLSLGGFIQDRWKPFKWLTINPGIRVDWGITKNTLDETVSNLVGVGPRIGFSADLTRDQKTIFSAYYGRANDVMSLMATGNFADISAINSVYRYNPTTNTWPLQVVSGGAGGYRIDPNATTPHTDEFTASLRREVFHDSVASIEYTYKQTSNIWDAVEVNQIWDPSGTRVVGFVNGKPEQVFKVTTPDANQRIYHGLDFIVESRPSPNWDIYAAYTVSWLYGPGSEQLGQISGYFGSSGFYNPRQRMFYDGYLPEDHRHNLKLRASYSWHGLIVGALLNYLSGAPASKGFFDQNDGGYLNLRSPQGTEPGISGKLGTPNNPASWSEFRLPDTLSVDVRIAYDFHELIKQHIILMADFFNLFDLTTPTGFDATNSSTFGVVSSRMTPFRFEIGLRYVY